MSLDSVMEHDYTAVMPDMEMGQMVHAISHSRDSYLPVVNQNGTFMGEIDINKIRNIVFRTELYHRFHVKDLMTPPVATLSMKQSMEDVMNIFDKTGALVLPVLDDNDKLLGFISRNRLFTMYRKMVADLSEEYAYAHVERLDPAFLANLCLSAIPFSLSRLCRYNTASVVSAPSHSLFL